MIEQKIGQKLGKKNQEIINQLAHAPFKLRERNGHYSVRVCFTIDGRKFQREKSIGQDLDIDKLLNLWRVIDKIKAGELPIDAFNGGDEKQAQSDDSIKHFSIEEAIALFGKEFWGTRLVHNPKARTTWQGYNEVLSKIPLDESIVSIDYLKELVLSHSIPETRKREKWVMVCARLGAIAGVDTSAIKVLKGSDRTLKKRYIPDDGEILEARKSIVDPSWRWIFGILAAYGLRPSELFHFDFDNVNRGIIKVGADTKTGERIVYPLRKQWLSDWGLIKVNYPQSLEKSIGTSQLTNQEKGGKISRKFKSLGLNFTPYALRDAYAIRGAVLGISPSIVSQWMGHSLTVHYTAYQRYLSEREWSQVWGNL